MSAIPPVQAVFPSGSQPIAEPPIAPLTSAGACTWGYMYSAKRWLVWAANKQPFYPDGSPRKNPDTQADWDSLGTYEQARDAVTAGAGRFVGVGFALGPDGTGNYWQGIDLDDVPQNQLADLANNAPGYVEQSPSGNGAHVIGYGKHFHALGSNKSGVEAYAQGRYFTFTGNMIRDGGLVCLADYVMQRVAPAHGAARSGSTGGDAAVSVDPKTVSELRSALAHIRSDDRDLWVRMGMALRELGDVGRGLWLAWSATSDKHRPEDAKKWDGFKPENTGYQAVFAEAQRQGWINPSSNAARLLAQESPMAGEKSGADLLSELYVDYWGGGNDVEVPDIVEGLVADEEVTLLGGHGGIGKSFLALQIACAVATGIDVLNQGTRQCRVLYYSAEDGKKRLTRRLRNMVSRFNYDREVLWQNLVVLDASEREPLFGESREDKGNTGYSRFIDVPGSSVDFYNLQKMVEAYDPQLLIIDGASDTFDGNEIFRREVRAFIKMLRRVHPQRKIAVLLMVHIDRATARGHSSNDEGYAGNTQWHNSCRRRIFLQAKKEKDEEGNEIGETISLRVMKNQDGAPIPDMEVERNEDGFWQLSGSKTEIQFGGKLAEFLGIIDEGSILLKLIGDYYARGQYINTSLAPQSKTGVYDVLQGDKDFPKKLNKKRTNDLVRNLEREGKLVKGQYKRPNRSVAECWKVAEGSGI